MAEVKDREPAKTLLRRRWYNRFFRWSWGLETPVTVNAQWGDDQEWWFRGFYLLRWNFGVMYRGRLHSRKHP